MENAWANDKDRYVLEAHPGESQGRPERQGRARSASSKTACPAASSTTRTPGPGETLVRDRPADSCQVTIFMPRQAVAGLTWATGDEPMTGAQASYLETFSREAGEEAPPADLTKAPSIRAASTRSSSKRGGAPSAPHSVAAKRHMATPSITRPRTTITLASKSAGRCQPNPQKLIRTRLSRR